MPILKSFSFTALPKAGNDPVQMRRAKFIAKLEEQKLLLGDSSHVRVVQRWTKVNGERQATTKQQAVRPWWKTDASGQLVMSVKFGAKCQSAFKFDPVSASNFDPLERLGLAVALVSSELAGIAETRRARVA